jgi:hypothetical protein
MTHISASKRTLLALATAAGVAAFFTVLGSGVIRCPMWTMFHVPCPGCGSSRAGHALLAFEPLEALRTNPIVPFVIALMLAMGLRAVWVVYRDGSLRNLGDGRLGTFLTSALTRTVVLAVVVWVLRLWGLFGGLPDQGV